MKYSSLAAIILLLFALSAPAFASSGGTITLRLDEGASACPAREGQPSETPSVIVPPTQFRTPAPPRVKAVCAVLMDAETGQVLYSKNPRLHRPNASTTKIMTAILLIEHCGMTEMIKASKKASNTPFTSLNLKPGELISARDLLTGMMVRSANDAAVAAAEHIAGNTAKFAAIMNSKARAIGCADTHFVTPNGLYDPKHYSSAYDLCLLARYALKYPLFNEVVSTRKHFLGSRTINRKDLAVFNRCKFLRDYPGADGVKSGYVKQAGYCLVGSATRNGWRLVSAVLKSDNAGRDTAAIMDYAFANFQPVTVAKADAPCAKANVAGGNMGMVGAVPVRDFYVVVPRTGATVTTRLDLKSIEAPIAKGVKLGRLVALVNGTEAASVELRSAENVGVSFARRAWSSTKVCGLVFVCLFVGGRIGRTTTKGARGRRRRVTATLRGFDRRW